MTFGDRSSREAHLHQLHTLYDAVGPMFPCSFSRVGLLAGLAGFMFYLSSMYSMTKHVRYPVRPRSSLRAVTPDNIELVHELQYLVEKLGSDVVIRSLDRALGQDRKQGEMLQGYNDAELARVWSKVPMMDAPQLPRLMSNSQLVESLSLTSQVVDFFNKYGIEYFICYGTLLGSYLSHSVLAWDDDIDLVIHVKHQELLQTLAKNKSMNAYGFAYSFHCMRWNNKSKTFCENPKNKIWPKNAIWFSGHKWLHPFVDVIGYDSNATHYWMLNNNHSFVMPINTLYPLQKRPLNGLWFNAPREPYAFLSSNYWGWAKNTSARTLTCSWPRWNHWADLYFNGWRKVDCAGVVPYYPFVRRYKTSSGETQEDLQLNNETYYSMITSETFKPEWLPEPHRLEWLEYWPRETLFQVED